MVNIASEPRDFSEIESEVGRSLQTDDAARGAGRPGDLSMIKYFFLDQSMIKHLGVIQYTTSSRTRKQRRRRNQESMRALVLGPPV